MPHSGAQLVVVGTGIRTVGQMTVESIAWMKRADRLLYLVADPTSEQIIRSLNPGHAESLSRFYGDHKERRQTYEEIVEHILGCLRSGHTTCAAFYGHPGVFVLPSHQAVQRARAEGFEARMLPAVSAEDCLVADLGFDPATAGCQTYEATDFMVHRRVVEPSAALVLWQIGLLANWSYESEGYDLKALPLLLERLYDTYPPDHQVTVYEGATQPGAPAFVARTPLSRLSEVAIPAMATLYVPPLRAPTADRAAWDRLREMGIRAPAARAGPR